ncbi:hypothetical protein ACUN9W_26495, partial [Escherichia coli]
FQPLCTARQPGRTHRAAVRHAIYDFQLNVYNLFDTDYVASINKSGYRYHPGEPRTFLLTANMHF